VARAQRDESNAARRGHAAHRAPGRPRPRCALTSSRASPVSRTDSRSGSSRLRRRRRPARTCADARLGAYAAAIESVCDCLANRTLTRLMNYARMPWADLLRGLAQDPRRHRRPARSPAPEEHRPRTRLSRNSRPPSSSASRTLRNSRALAHIARQRGERPRSPSRTAHGLDMVQNRGAAERRGQAILGSIIFANRPE